MLHIKIFIAFLSNNRRGKSFDVHGRSYRYAYRKFGHNQMINEYTFCNSWRVK